MTPQQKFSLLATCETNQNAQGMPQRRADTLQVCRASKLNTLAGPLQHSFSFLKQAGHPEGNLGVLRWCALSLTLPQIYCSPVYQ